jgi:hypothetical protein
MENIRNIKDLRHAQKCVKKLNKIQERRPLTSNEIQERYFWESRVEEEYAKPLK